MSACGMRLHARQAPAPGHRHLETREHGNRLFWFAITLTHNFCRARARGTGPIAICKSLRMETGKFKLLS